jgi:hypothetical protein
LRREDERDASGKEVHMTGTIHERPTDEVRVTDTPVDVAAPAHTTSSRTTWSTLRDLSLGAVVLVVSGFIGYVAMDWATRRGNGHQLTPLSMILIITVALAFAITEVVSAVRARKRSRATEQALPQEIVDRGAEGTSSRRIASSSSTT